MLLQPDGHIVIGGSFASIGGTLRANIARLLSDGSLDSTFNPNADGTVWSLAQQRDGAIYAGGFFHTIGAVPQPHIARLSATGVVDTGWAPVLAGEGVDGTVHGIALQADGKLLITGFFLTVDEEPRETIARLSADSPAAQSLDFDEEAGVLTWYASGSGPEPGRVVFERSDDGVNFTSLGEGVRISGGWRLTEVSIPYAGRYWIRVRQYSSHGLFVALSSAHDAAWIFYRFPYSVFLPLTRKG
jgi:uncharacterized delta-60 repeat protein